MCLHSLKRTLVTYATRETEHQAGQHGAVPFEQLLQQDAGAAERGGAGGHGHGAHGDRGDDRPHLRARYVKGDRERKVVRSRWRKRGNNRMREAADNVGRERGGGGGGGGLLKF